MQTPAFRDMLRLRREIARAEATLLQLRPELARVEAQVQAEQGKCGCWLPHGDPKCMCGVLGRRKAVDTAQSA